MNVLVADDEKNIRDTLAQILSLDGITTVTAENGLSAQRMLQEQRFDALILDLRMPGMDGLQLLAWMNESGPQIPTIVVSAHGDVRDAVTAMKEGAVDYVTKPFDPDDLVIRLRRAVDDDRLRREVFPGGDVGAGPGGVGPETTDTAASRNEVTQRILKTADRVAPSDSTVLITGESGTGKEVMARRIHQHSGRAGGPFRPINLGAVPETLIESELFGHEKGAFTGATVRKPGLFETAAGGTLFLDEIGELPVHLQVKLLRVLQERTLERVGGTVTIPVDVRIIAATNRDLQRGIGDGTFREDLYYRLNVIELHLPPLRERPEDIGTLIGVFIEAIRRRGGPEIAGVDPDAIRRLQGYRFPGNIRELENIIERAALLADAPTLRVRDFEFLGVDEVTSRPSRLTDNSSEDGAPTGADDRPRTLSDIEAEAIRRALLRNDGHRERTAGELGITRRTLLNKINAYGIEV